MSIAIGAAIAVMTGIGAGLGIGYATAKSSEAIARQPEASGQISKNLILGCALAEATAIYGFLIGILLAWTYYKTGSLIPCILMHVLNNSLSVYLSIKYPEAENMDDLINGTPYLIVLFGSILLFIGIILTMNHLTSQK